MTMPYFQINVPIRHSMQPERRGLHLFIGPAGSGPEALRIVRELCNEALHALAVDSHVPHRRADGWGARGTRPGWDFDWASATVKRWEDTQLIGPSTTKPFGNLLNERTE